MTARYIRKAPYDDHPDRVTIDPVTKKKRYRCRWCFAELTGRKRGWCSQACVDEFLIRKSGTVLRSAVYARDRGRCARCGIDCRELRRMLRKLSSGHRARSRRVPQAWEHPYNRKADRQHERRLRRGARRRAKKLAELRPKLEALYAWMERRGWGEQEIRWGKTLWQADHIRAVVEGGGGCGLENLRTVCVPCHHAITAELASRRARRKRATGDGEP